MLAAQPPLKGPSLPGHSLSRSSFSLMDFEADSFYVTPSWGDRNERPPNADDPKPMFRKRGLSKVMELHPDLQNILKEAKENPELIHDSALSPHTSQSTSPRTSQSPSQSTNPPTSKDQPLGNVSPRRKVSKTPRRPTLRRQTTKFGLPSLFSPTKSDDGTIDEPAVIELPPDGDDILYTVDAVGRVCIRAATSEKLVERLISPHLHDASRFRNAFLRTYRGFMDPYYLLDLLKKYYLSTDDGEHDDTGSRVHEHRKLAICTVIKQWCKDFFRDFERDKHLYKKVREFLISVIQADAATHGGVALTKTMQATLDGLKKKLSVSSIRQKRESSRVELVSSYLLDAPIIDPFGRFSPSKIAEQITSLDWEIFRRITPAECLGQAWTRDDAGSKAPNILALIASFNSLSNWMVSLIVEETSLLDRTQALIKVILMGKRFMEIRNFNGIFTVISALGSSTVSRLKKTWAALPDHIAKEYREQLEPTASHQKSYKTYRHLLANSDPPCLPYLGVYLTDLTFIEDGNADCVDGPAGALINWTKRQMLSATIEKMLLYGQVGYDVVEEVPLMAFLRNPPAMTLDEAYAASLRVEPRNPEEAMENLLKEDETQKRAIKMLQTRVNDLEDTITLVNQTNLGLMEEIHRLAGILRHHGISYAREGVSEDNHGDDGAKTPLKKTGDVNDQDEVDVDSGDKPMDGHAALGQRKVGAMHHVHKRKEGSDDRAANVHREEAKVGRTQKKNLGKNIHHGSGRIAQGTAAIGNQQKRGRCGSGRGRRGRVAGKKAPGYRPPVPNKSTPPLPSSVVADHEEKATVDNEETAIVDHEEKATVKQCTEDSSSIVRSKGRRPPTTYSALPELKGSIIKSERAGANSSALPISNKTCTMDNKADTTPNRIAIPSTVEINEIMEECRTSLEGVDVGIESDGGEQATDEIASVMAELDAELDDWMGGKL